MFAEAYHEPDDAVTRARARAERLAVTPVTAGVAAMLSVLASASRAQNVVEIGTGAGVSGVALLSGMGQEGLLTTIDLVPENSHAARETFADAGVRSNRLRVITGDAAVVLPRLADATYDMVFLDLEGEVLTTAYEQGLRLLRPGGLIVVDSALWKGRVADPARRDPQTVIMRDLGRRVRDDPSLTSAMLAVGDGLLVAVRH